MDRLARNRSPDRALQRRSLEYRHPAIRADKLNAMTKERVLAGYQIGFHAIGDKGVQMALDAFAGAEKAAKDAKAKAADGGDSGDYRLGSSTSK